MHFKPTPVCLKYVEILLNTPKHSLKKTYFPAHPCSFEVFLPYVKHGEIELAYKIQALGNG